MQHMPGICEKDHMIIHNADPFALRTRILPTTVSIYGTSIVIFFVLMVMLVLIYMDRKSGGEQQH